MHAHWIFRQWMYAMGNHERYEEGKLYPYLEARWGLSCESLREGHMKKLVFHETPVAASDAAFDDGRRAARSAVELGPEDLFTSAPRVARDPA